MWEEQSLSEKGDVYTDELDEKGINLLDYIKKTYNYHPDRVSKALNDITN